MGMFRIKSSSLRQKWIHHRRLIKRRRHQAVKYKIYTVCRTAFAIHTIQVIKSTIAIFTQYATFGRLWIGIRHMTQSTIFGFTMNSDIRCRLYRSIDSTAIKNHCQNSTFNQLTHHWMMGAMQASS